MNGPFLRNQEQCIGNKDVSKILKGNKAILQILLTTYNSGTVMQRKLQARMIDL